MNLGQIPHVSRFEVELNGKQDPLSQEMDIIVHAEFKDQEQLEAYKAHPIYQECINLVRPLRNQRFAVNYSSSW